MVMQKRVNTDSNWETVLTDVFPGRDYVFFGWLAGVRCNIGEPVGTPINEFELMFAVPDHSEFWMGDHDFGCITLDEFLTAKIPKVWKKELQPYKDAAKLFLGPWDTSNVRFVYGFDS